MALAPASLELLSSLLLSSPLRFFVAICSCSCCSSQCSTRFGIDGLARPCTEATNLKWCCRRRSTLLLTQTYICTDLHAIFARTHDQALTSTWPAPPHAQYNRPWILSCYIERERERERESTFTSCHSTMARPAQSPDVPWHPRPHPRPTPHARSRCRATSAGVAAAARAAPRAPRRRARRAARQPIARASTRRTATRSVASRRCAAVHHRSLVTGRRSTMVARQRAACRSGRAARRRMLRAGAQRP